MKRDVRVAGGVLVGLAIGAIAQYYLDPQHGRARRARSRDRATAGVRRLGRRMAKAERRAASDLRGRARRTMHRHAGPAPDDATLVDRVESQVYLRHHGFKGRINLEARNGIVTVRGQLSSRHEIEQVVAAVRDVDGVVAVHSLLHVEGTAAPNKAAVIHLGGGVGRPGRARPCPRRR
jgi:hyperosmotically inducible periplasmic protein